jgi:hypothetical protein
MVHEVGSPKGITGISHKPNSGIYCVGLSGGIDASDAMATLTINSTNGGDVNTEPTAPDCAQGQAQVDTFELEQSGTTTAGAPLNEVLADQGFVVMVP